MLGVYQPRIGRAIAYLAHFSSTGRILHLGAHNPDPHSSCTMWAAHPEAHHSTTHSFIAGQAGTSQPAYHPLAGRISSNIVTPVSEPPSAKHQTGILDLVSCGIFSRWLDHFSESRP